MKDKSRDVCLRVEHRVRSKFIYTFTGEQVTNYFNKLDLQTEEEIRILALDKVKDEIQDIFGKYEIRRLKDIIKEKNNEIKRLNEILKL